MIQLHELRNHLMQAQGNVLSLYLNLDLSSAPNHAWRVWLKNALRETGSQINEQEQADWRAAEAFVNDFMSTYVPDSKGLTLFAGRGVQSVYRLPLAPVKHLLLWGKPLIAPMIGLMNEDEPYVVALVDHEKARFFVGHLGSTPEHEQMTLNIDEYEWSEKTRQPVTVPGADGGYAIGGGNNREAFASAVAEVVKRFHREVAEHTEKLLAKHNAARLVLGGDERAAHAVQNLLRDKTPVVAILSLPLRSTPHEVMQHILPVVVEHERQREQQLLEQIVDLAKSGGRGALGRADVLRALEEQRVELVLAPYPLEEELAAKLSEKLLASSANFEMVHGAAAAVLRQQGGLAARLYYTVSVSS